MSIKVGDCVKLKDDLVVDGVYGGLTLQWERYRDLKGKKFKITGITVSGNYITSLGWIVSKEMINEEGESMKFIDEVRRETEKNRINVDNIKKAIKKASKEGRYSVSLMLNNEEVAWLIEEGFAVTRKHQGVYSEVSWKEGE